MAMVPVSQSYENEKNSLTVRIEEEKSRDTETSHAKEAVGFMVVLPE